MGPSLNKRYIWIALGANTVIHLEKEIFILAILSLWGLQNVDRIFRKKKKKQGPPTKVRN